MNLMIEISEEHYNRIKENCAVDRRYVPIGWVSIANGIPIPCEETSKSKPDDEGYSFWDDMLSGGQEG